MTVKAKIFLFISAVLLAFQYDYGRSLTADQWYAKQKCEPFNYEIIVPSGWHIDELTLSRKHIFISYYGLAEIKVRAFTSDDMNIDGTMRKNSWNLRKIDPLLNRIIETEKVSVKKNINGKLLVFEYRSMHNRMLQRTMITKNDDTVYIIDCRAPLKSFYGYEKFFNIALSSFNYLSAHTTLPGKADHEKEPLRNPEFEEPESSPGGKTVKEPDMKSSQREIEEDFFDLE